MNNERIDLCACFDPIFMPPDEVLAEWEKRRYADDVMQEPTLENTSCFFVEPDGSKFMMVGKMMIKISEHFSENGKDVGNLIEDVIQYSANRRRK